MMLANAAITQNGALTIIGAGWIVRPPAAATSGPSAIALMLRLPRDELQEEHQVRLELLDANGQIVVVDPPDGPGPMVIESDVATPQSAQNPAITIPLTVGIGFNLPPFPLPRSAQYRWRLFVDGETRDGWTLPFRTSPPAAPRQRNP